VREGFAQEPTTAPKVPLKFLGQECYFAKPGKAEEVYQWRLHVSEVLEKVGVPRGARVSMLAWKSQRIQASKRAVPPREHNRVRLTRMTNGGRPISAGLFLLLLSGFSLCSANFRKERLGSCCSRHFA
jgi:hypothetical protein